MWYEANKKHEIHRRKYSTLCSHYIHGDCTVTMVTSPVTKKILTWPAPRQAQRLVLQSVSSLGPNGACSFTAMIERETETQKWNVVSSYTSSLHPRRLVSNGMSKRHIVFVVVCTKKKKRANTWLRSRWCWKSGSISVFLAAFELNPWAGRSQRSDLDASGLKRITEKCWND